MRSLWVATVTLSSLGAMAGTSGAAPIFSARSLYFDVANGTQRVAVGDVDGDARPDYVATHGTISFGVTIFWGEGDGGYGSKLTLTAGSFPKDVVIADMNGDGRKDLVVANSGAATVSIFPATGPRTFGARVDYPAGNQPASLALADL